MKWFRLDDGVMGGLSDTQHVDVDGHLCFAGKIDTNGGGFASVRSNFEAGQVSGEWIRLRYKGDGKTYKVLLSNGSMATPWSASPSWQHDLPTVQGEEAEAVLQYINFTPSFGGKPSKNTDGLALVPGEMGQVGIMLSLYLSDGSSNPEETFGAAGTAFDFQLDILSLETGSGDPCSRNKS